MSSNTDTVGVDTSSKKKPQVVIYDCGAWSAVYVNGELKYWDDTPSSGQMLDILDIEYERRSMPSDYDKLCRWSPPNSLKAFEREIAKINRRKIDVDIAACEKKLSGLKEIRDQFDREYHDWL